MLQWWDQSLYVCILQLFFLKKNYELQTTFPKLAKKYGPLKIRVGVQDGGWKMKCVVSCQRPHKWFLVFLLFAYSEVFHVPIAHSSMWASHAMKQGTNPLTNPLPYFISNGSEFADQHWVSSLHKLKPLHHIIVDPKEIDSLT